jgi:hypothetical protein
MLSHDGVMAVQAMGALRISVTEIRRPYNRASFFGTPFLLP